MAVKRKISKSEFEALSDDKKEFYIENKDRKGEYILDMDADFNKELTDALDTVKAERDTLKTKNGELTGELAAEKAKKQPADGSITKDDHEAIVKSLNTKLADADKKHGETVSRKDAFIRKTLIDSKALEIAAKISKAPKLMLPHVKARLSADLDGDEPKTVVLDADGKPSAYTLEDLSNELVANADFADIVIGSQARGGNPPNGTGGGNALQGNNPPAPLSSMQPTDIVAQMRARHPDLRT